MKQTLWRRTRILAALGRATKPLTSEQIADAAWITWSDIYEDLSELEVEGIVSSDWKNRPAPRRRRYWLTEKGGDVRHAT